jgi:hypothetical protein
MLGDDPEHALIASARNAQTDLGIIDFMILLIECDSGFGPILISRLPTAFVLQVMRKSSISRQLDFSPI